ncbi:MAG: hypothetical protein PVJ42_09880 [bacterium]|jgi:hypothetical protein
MSKLLLTGFCMLAVIAVAGAALAHDPPASAASGAVPVLDSDGVTYVMKQTDGNALGLVISNYGFFGNNFVTRNPSMEYPLGSEIDHLIRAGLWIGAITVDGDIVVSTGAISGYWGTSTATASEYTPLEGNKLKERSTLITSRAYSKLAVSEQDFVGAYADVPRASTNDAVLNVEIRQESYLWSYDFAEAFVIVSFTVYNRGEGILQAPYLGVFGELSSGWKGAYDTWRPPGNAWFRNKVLEYFPDNRMVGEHHQNFQWGDAPTWGAIALLGAQGRRLESIDDLTVSFNWWDWYWERDNPMEDQDRYEMMKNGEIDETADITPGADDPIELLSAGPFPDMAKGDSLLFVVAFLGGKNPDDLVSNAEWAQRAFDNQYVLPSPPPPPRFRVTPGSGFIKVYWDDYPEDQYDPFYQIMDFEGYRIYVTRVEGATSEDFDMVRDVDKVDTLGYDTGFESVRDSVYFGDSLYVYNTTIPNVKDGFKYWVAITSYDTGIEEENVVSMESGLRATQVLVIPGTTPEDAEAGGEVVVFPNPYNGAAIWDGSRDREKYIWFANLPQRATIRIFTLAGDLVKTLEFDGATYDAADIQGLQTSQERIVAMPGGICGWDLITDKDQAAATGLYMFSVLDKGTGEQQVGKFLIIR